MTEDEERAAAIAEAKTWMGTPWHHEAMVKGEGVDCAYLLIGVFSNIGLIEKVTPDHYPMDWALNRHDERYLGWVEQFAVRVPRAKPADIVLFRTGRAFGHGGIVTEWPKIIHASRYDKGVVWGNALKDHRLFNLKTGERRDTVIYRMKAWA